MEKKEECSKRTQETFESYDGKNIRELDEGKLNDLIDDSLKLNYGQFIDELINNVVYCNTKKFFEKNIYWNL